MALLNILQFPDPRLKKIASPVEVFDQSITELVNNMFETLYEVPNSAGLAAIQVNEQRRVIVIDVSGTRSQPLCLINPEITATRGSLEWDEGCLSFPGVYARVKRAKEIEVNFRDREGRLQNITAADDLLCVCIQHEIDHLNGITFYDHLSPLKQALLRKKLTKIRKRSL